MSKETLRRWEISGKIKSHKTPGGHRRYAIQDVEDLIEQIKAGVVNSNEVLTPKPDTKQPSFEIEEVPLSTSVKVTLFLLAMASISFAYGYWALAILSAVLFMSFVGIAGAMDPLKLKRLGVLCLIFAIGFTIPARLNSHQTTRTIKQGETAVLLETKIQGKQTGCANANAEITKFGLELKQSLALKTMSTGFAAPRAKRKALIQQRIEEVKNKAQELRSIC